MAQEPRVGHKVVAMPPEDSPFKLRERPEPSDESAAMPYYRRLRSRSAGRAPASRSRDIVQDVYDRMGVNYIRGRPSIDNLIEDNKALGHITQDSSEEVSRGRSSTRDSEVGLPPHLAVAARQRSRSRGRQWPPATRATNASKDKAPGDEMDVARKKPDSQNWFTPTPQKTYKAERKSMPYGSSKSLLDVHESDNRDEESRHDAPDDERDGLSVVSGFSMKSTKSTKSVKERISAYSASARSSTMARVAPVRHSHGGNFDRSASGQKADGSVVSFPTGFKETKEFNTETSSRFDQASHVSGGRNRFSSQASVSQRSAKSGVADAFLGALAASSRPNIAGNISVVEIPKDGLSHGSDQSSVAASSVSGEDWAPSPRKKKGPLFRVGGVDKAVEDRIQSQITILNKKFEAEVRRIENRIDQECKARITDLEKRNEDLVELLALRGMALKSHE